jgi:hypothetical protein
MTMARHWLGGMVLAAPLAWNGPAAAQGTLNLYCSVQIEWCQAIANNFQRDSGIRVNMTQRGSGETLAAIRAEAQNPRGDVWFGGTGDPHLAAARRTCPRPIEREQRQPAALGLNQWRQSRPARHRRLCRRVGFGFNTSCWPARTRAADLLADPAGARASAARSRWPTRIPPAPPMSSLRRSCSCWGGAGLRLQAPPAPNGEQLCPQRHRPD